MRSAVVLCVGALLLVCVTMHVQCQSTLYGLVNPQNVQLVSINLSTFQQTNIGPATGMTTQYSEGILPASIDTVNRIIYFMNSLPGDYESSQLIGLSLDTGLVVKNFPTDIYMIGFIQVDNSTGEILLSGSVSSSGCAQVAYVVNNATGKLRTLVDCFPQTTPLQTSVFDTTTQMWYGSYVNNSYYDNDIDFYHLYGINPTTGAYTDWIVWSVAIDLGLQFDPVTDLMWSVSYPALGVGDSGCHSYRSLMTLNTANGNWVIVSPLPVLYGCCNPPAAVPANSPLDLVSRTITTINVDYKLYTFDLTGRIVHTSTGKCVNNQSCPMYMGYA